MKNIDYQNYIKIMNLLHLNYYRLDKEELQKLLVQDRMNITKSFEFLEDFQPIVPSKNIDNYIVNNLELWNNYKKDIFFQYAYISVGAYTFDNKKEFLKFLDGIYQSLYELNIKNIDKIIKKISKKEKTKFIVNQKQKNLTNQLNKFFQNQDILNIFEKKLNDKEQFCNIFGSCIENVEKLIEKIIFVFLLFKEKLNEEELISVLLQDKNLDEYIQETLIKHLNIKDKNNKEEKVKALEFIYEQIVKEGYYFHGTGSINRQSILENGLSSNKIPIMTKQIKEINKIFEQHNLYMNFEGKMRELKLHQYYVTDSINSSVMYAFQSPEYLSRFCSNGYHQENTRIFDREAFWRRDFNACKNNIEMLCNNYDFSEEEKIEVFNNFNELWYNTVSEDEVPIIFMGQKKNIGRDYSQKFDRIYNNIDKYTMEDIIALFELGDNIRDKRLSIINAESISYFSLPNIHKMYHLTSFDKFYSRQYITYKNKKYYPDVVIDKSPLKCIGIILDENIKDPIMINNQLIIISPKKGTNYIYLNNYYKIDMNIFVSESGKALTKNGQEFINSMRKKISIDNIIKYNQNLIQESLDQFNTDYHKLNDEQKMLFVHFLVNQLLVKTISMKKYNNYYVDIDAALNRLVYFSIDKENKLNRIVKQKVIDSEFVSEILEIIKITQKTYEPYHDLMHIFYDIEPK